MPSYRLGQAAKTLGVSVDTVRRMVDDGRLVAVRTTGGQRLIEGESLAALAKPKRKDRREAAVKQSARNRGLNGRGEVERRREGFGRHRAEAFEAAADDFDERLVGRPFAAGVCGWLASPGAVPLAFAGSSPLPECRPTQFSSSSPSGSFC